MKWSIDVKIHCKLLVLTGNKNLESTERIHRRRNYKDFEGKFEISHHSIKKRLDKYELHKHTRLTEASVVDDSISYPCQLNSNYCNLSIKI